MHVFVFKMVLTGLFMPLVIFAPLHLKTVISVVDPSGIGSQGQYRQGELLFFYTQQSAIILLYTSLMLHLADTPGPLVPVDGMSDWADVF